MGDGVFSPVVGNLDKSDMLVNTKLGSQSLKRDEDSKKDPPSSPAGKKKDKKVTFPGKADKKTKPSPDDKDDDEAIENPSSLLTLSILDSANSNEVNLNYYREK